MRTRFFYILGLDEWIKINNVPELILRGKWLVEFGFEKESREVINASEDLIVIQPQKQKE